MSKVHLGVKRPIRKYDGILVINTYTNELVASGKLEQPQTRKLKK